MVVSKTIPIAFLLCLMNEVSTLFLVSFLDKGNSLATLRDSLELDVAAIETFDDLIQAFVKVESLTVQEKQPHQDKIVPGQSSPIQTKPLWNPGTDTQIK